MGLGRSKGNRQTYQVTELQLRSGRNPIDAEPDRKMK